MKKYHAVNDGYGIVGFGFTCDVCEKDNNFVDTNEDTQICQWCKAVNKLISYDEDETDFFSEYILINE